MYQVIIYDYKRYPIDKKMELTISDAPRRVNQVLNVSAFQSEINKL